MNDSPGISEGRDWGTPETVPSDLVVCTSDAEAAISPVPVGLSGGDLHRSLGTPTVPGPGQTSTVVRVDRMRCEIDTDHGPVSVMAVSHVLVGRFVGAGRFTGCVNAGFVGEKNLTPRSHPGDGRVEVVTVDPEMSLRQRLVAVRRARTGTHVPHPMVSITAAQEWETTRRGREVLIVDGRRIRRWSRVRVTVEPGSLSVYL